MNATLCALLLAALFAPSLCFDDDDDYNDINGFDSYSYDSEGEGGKDAFEVRKSSGFENYLLILAIISFTL